MGSTDPMQVVDCGRQMYGWLKDLFPICRSITGDGVRLTLRYLQDLAPIEVHELPSGMEVFDWTIPDEWNIRDAWLDHENEGRILDFKQLNLHVLGYSDGIDAWLSKEELLQHLYSLPLTPDVTPYLTSYYERRWGFCLPDRIKQSLPDGKYHAFIDATLQPGHLTFGDCIVPGQLPDEIIVSSYVCHPSMANDNLSGVVLTTALARTIAAGQRRRYTYRFIWVPETIGAIAYLFLQKEHFLQKVRAGLVATCTGDRGTIHYKRSRQGEADIDRAVQHVLERSGKPFKILDFFPSGSDERQYCSPGFNLPVGSLMCTPYGMFPEYHTSADNLDLVSAERLGDMWKLYMEVFDVIEANRRYVRTNPFCEPQLGKRGLYPSLGSQKETAETVGHRSWLLNLATPEHDLIEIATRADCHVLDLIPVVDELKGHGLLSCGETSEPLCSDKGTSTAIPSGDLPPKTISTPDRRAFSEGCQNLYDESYFSRGSYGMDARRKAMYLQEMDRLKPLMAKGGRVLDVGCGLGDFLDLFPATWERYGIEISSFARTQAEKRGIEFEFPDGNDFFDLVIFRGSLQHLDEPLAMINRCKSQLRPGGHIVFLATPNAGGICYRLFQDLPMLSAAYNYVVFSDRILKQCLLNLGFEEVQFYYPYIRTPYARPINDIFSFLMRCVGVRRSFAFWGNVFECYARKPEVR